MSKTTTDEGKFCVGLGIPAFGYTSAADVNSAAQNAELDLFRDLYGNPSDPQLYDCNPFVGECNCQRNVHDRVEKLIATLGREWVKCKKNALKVNKLPFSSGAASSAELEICMTDGGTPGTIPSDTKGKLGKRSQNILDAITKQACNSTGNDSFGGPECNRTALGGSPTDSALRDCLHKRAYCRFCQMVNAMDGLAVNCDGFDDGLSNTSCP